MDTDLKSLILPLTAGFPVLATGGPSAEVIGLPMGPGLRMDPYFVKEAGIADNNTRNLTVHTGQKAYLECRVRNLGAKRVRIALRIPRHPRFSLSKLKYFNGT